MINRLAVMAVGLTTFVFTTGNLWAQERSEMDAVAATSETVAPDAVSIQINAAHSGNTQFPTALKFPLKEAWRVNLGGTVSYPLIADGRVFVTVGNNGAYGSTLFALNAKTGSKLWSTVIEGTYYWSGAAYESGQVFVLNFDGLLKAFDAKSGKLNWSVQVANEYFVTSPPVAQNGIVYVEGDGSSSLTAYAASTGALLWTQSIEAGDGAPALSSTGIFAYSPCQVFAFNPTSGKSLWRYSGDCDGGGGTTPVYANGSLYVSDPTGSGNQIFNSVTGAVTGIFEKSAAPPTVGVSKGYLLVNGTLEGVDLKTKKALWAFAGDGGLSLLPIKVNGTVFVGSTSGQLWGLDAATGKEVWSTDVGAPIVPNQCCTGPNTGLAASNGLLVIPATDLLVGYRQ